MTFCRVSLAALLLAIPALAEAFPNAPDGFGKARFGMKYEEVRKHYPDLVALSPAQSTSQLPVSLEIYELPGQTVLGLSPCTVRFYFGNLVLDRLSFDCGRDAKVAEALKKEFGPASEKAGNAVHWLTSERAVSVNPRNFLFTYTDRPLNAAFQMALMQATGSSPLQTPAPEAPTAPERMEDLEEQLDWFDDEKRLDRLLAQLPEAKTDDQLVRLLLNIAIFEEPRTVPAFQKYLAHESERVFELAMSGLEDVGGEAAVKAVGTLLDDPSIPRERRLLAVNALLEMNFEEGVVEQLAKGLADPDAEVRQESAMNIVYTGEDAAVPPLQAAYAKESDETTRKILGRALELLGASPKPEADDTAAADPASEKTL